MVVATRGRAGVLRRAAARSGVMSGCDIRGRPYARLESLNIGDMVELDDGFTCHAAGIVEVKYDPADTSDPFYFNCVGEAGEPQKHFLVGQLDEDGFLVGIYPVARP
jgi:hypothetical protein